MADKFLSDVLFNSGCFEKLAIHMRQGLKDGVERRTSYMFDPPGNENLCFHARIKTTFEWDFDEKVSMTTKITLPTYIAFITEEERAKVVEEIDNNIKTLADFKADASRSVRVYDNNSFDVCYLSSHGGYFIIVRFTSKRATPFRSEFVKF